MSAANCRAADPLSNYTLHTWHGQDGLVGEVVQAVVQTPDHFLWIGTANGLVRFDGRDFVPYSGPGAAALRRGVTSLLVAHDRSLFIGTDGSGVLHYHDGVMDEFGPAEGLANPMVRALLEDRNGVLWVATDHLCFRFRNGRFEQVESPARYPNLAVSAMLEDTQGAIWIGGNWLFKITGGHFQEFVLPAENVPMRIKSLYEGPDGSIWVGSRTGLFRQTPAGRFEKVAGVKGPVCAFGRLPSGAMWVGTVGEGLYVQSKGGFVHVQASKILPSNTLLSETTDVEGNLWIGTQVGLLRLSRTGIRWTQLPNALDSDFGSIMRDSDGTVWVCSSRVFRMIGDQLVPYRFAALPQVTIRTMFRERSGALWLGTAGRGAYRIDPAGKTTHYEAEIGSHYIRGFLQARDGSVWIASDSGISRYRDGHFDNYHHIAMAPRTAVFSLAEDTDGRLWVGTHGGLFTFYQGQFEDADFKQTFRDDSIWALHIDRDGEIWIGADSGLYRIKNGQIYRFPDALGGISKAVYQIMGEGDVLWVSGPTRAARFRRTDLDRTADAMAKDIAPHEIFLVSSEFPFAEMYGGMQPAGLLDPDGSAWFPTSAGPVHLVAADKPPYYAMPMMIEQILIDGHPSDKSKSLDLPPGTKTLEIDYAPILLGSQTRLQFRQELEGFDGWGTPTFSRSAIYTNLPAGRYVFHAQALSPEVNGPVSEVTISILQRAAFYYRPWFWVLCACVVLAATLGILRIRVYQIKFRLRTIAEERNRLAREMHDSLLQGCMGLSTLLEACASQGSSESSNGRMLDCAREQIRALISQTRDTMLDLRSHEYERCDFVLCVRELFEKHVKPSGLMGSFQSVGDELVMDYPIAYELLMSIREALLNAIAHSSGTLIDLNIVCSVSQLAVSIVDDGKGFSVHGKLSSQNGHYGLKGIRERVQSIGGALQISSSPGHGTRLDITILRRRLERRRDKELVF
jgi:ligand-binding sensor domain-containing protein/signal transduction histidine kinase